MASSVYVETSVNSYYTARQSRDIVTTARQTLTQEWWEAEDVRACLAFAASRERRLSSSSAV